jgi:hypothetical protein
MNKDLTLRFSQYFKQEIEHQKSEILLKSKEKETRVVQGGKAESI